jgi:DNA-binding transcriptional LysR family regulator
MNLTLRQLEAFALVARSRSFTAAAEQLHVSQSALSRTVAEVEKTLRVPLLQRNTRNVVPTPEGLELLAVAERILNEHRSGMGHLAGYLAGERGTVTIATLPSVAAVLLPHVLTELRQRRPDITVRILDGLAETVIEHVTTGRADLAISAPVDPGAQLQRQAFIRDMFFAALPRDHALAVQRKVSWSDLADEQFVALATDSSIRRLTDSAFTQTETHPAELIETRNIATVGGLVAAGLGVSALPALVRSLINFSGITHRPMNNPVLHRRLDLIRPKDRAPSPPAREFLVLLDELRTTGHELPRGVEGAAPQTAPPA